MSKEIVLLPDGLVVKERNLGKNRIKFSFFEMCARDGISTGGLTGFFLITLAIHLKLNMVFPLSS